MLWTEVKLLGREHSGNKDRTGFLIQAGLGPSFDSKALFSSLNSAVMCSSVLLPIRRFSISAKA